MVKTRDGLNMKYYKLDNREHLHTWTPTCHKLPALIFGDAHTQSVITERRGSADMSA